ncbi:isochorismatase family protein [Solwaraspora sp. WMMB335]|uniref:isochorismatase family protein n=1 Tax=Solwaraspora sp. WMMB335 TaxID=3404118 RepID=UPI003B92DC46
MAIPDISPYPIPDRDALPGNTTRWAVDAGRAVLLIHDMQEYFLRPFDTGRPPLNVVLDACARLRDVAREAGVPVLYTAQPGGMSVADRGLLMDFWGPGMPADPEQTAVVAPLRPDEGDRVLIKWRPSAFVRTGLLTLLHELGRDQLVICGVYAHVGILTTASDAFAWDIQAFVVSDAVADFSSALHVQALTYAATRCAAVTTAEDVSVAFARAGSVVS